jgi:hypothetical protein
MKILYIDMDNVLVGFPSGIARTPEHVQDQYEGRLDEVPGIFYLMDPIPGAIAAYEELATMFDTYILSTAPWGNPSAWSDKLLWVKDYQEGINILLDDERINEMLRLDISEKEVADAILQAKDTRRRASSCRS